MYSVERMEEIIRILKKKKNVSVKSLCEQLFVSVSTIRRDILELEKSGLIKRYRGGLALCASANNEHSYIIREVKNPKEKNYICELALDFIADGFSIFLDSSSTANHICPKLNRYNNLSIVTNGLKSSLDMNLMENIKTFITGGQLKTDSNSIIGEIAGDFIDNFQADICIISCAGIDGKGIYEADHTQALVKRHFIKNAKSTILLCDSSKFNSSHFHKLVEFKMITAVITDKRPSEEIETAIASEGCELIFQ